ncbi:MAG: hypothetical protein II306_07710 [Clostridia bacterium]|nr:hypothetical protein [Clostridia bacterium]
MKLTIFLKSGKVREVMTNLFEIVITKDGIELTNLSTFEVQTIPFCVIERIEV